VHQLVADADLDALDAALGELRAVGWPAPEDPESAEDTELGGRDHITDRLSDEVSWLRQCADWLARLDADSYPPAVNLRPAATAGENGIGDHAEMRVALTGRAGLDRLDEVTIAILDEAGRGHLAHGLEQQRSFADTPGRRAFPQEQGVAHAVSAPCARSGSCAGGGPKTRCGARLTASCSRPPS
jgi:hypothetical protein